MILILGGEGNMGRRYRAILDYLQVPWLSSDIKKSDVSDTLDGFKGVIIATPTPTHTEFIRKFADCGAPILCEKPITTDLKDLDETLNLCRKARTRLNMVYQYRLFDEPKNMGPTSYDYFKHGSDGLAWDCIQLIGLARGQVQLSEESPLWRSRLNGRVLDIAAMDLAYVSFIQQWLKSPGQSLQEIRDIHQKTDSFARERLHV